MNSLNEYIIYGNTYFKYNEASTYSLRVNQIPPFCCPVGFDTLEKYDKLFDYVKCKFSDK